jgi:hypothetical protein
MAARRPAGILWSAVRSTLIARSFPDQWLLAAGSPLTVARAAPVLHRTSLSHRCRAVAQADMPRHPSPQFAMLPPLREQEG